VGTWSVRRRGNGARRGGGREMHAVQESENIGVEDIYVEMTSSS